MRIVFVFALLVSSIAHAGLDTSKIPTKALTLRVLKKPIRVFHWSLRKNIPVAPTGPIDSQDPAIQKNIESRTVQFWNFYNNGMDGRAAGPGLYAALDPVSTESYGQYKTNWILYSMEISTGTVLLDIANTNIDPELMKVMKSYQCSETNWANLARSGNNSCRYFLSELASTYGIKAFLYQYSSNSIAICNPITDRIYNAALAIIDSTAINFSNTFAFVPETNDSKAEAEMNFIRYYFWLSRSPHTSGNHINENDPWTNLDKMYGYGNTYNSNPYADRVAANAEYWARTNLLNCNSVQEVFP